MEFYQHVDNFLAKSITQNWNAINFLLFSSKNKEDIINAFKRGLDKKRPKADHNGYNGQADRKVGSKQLFSLATHDEKADYQMASKQFALLVM
ncbi:hypothetical protein G9A89_000646 [Geosiphon pyriformis]|nr:hypothetical protein G9A89_000646 [Geosiphon pyriformis]